MSTKLQGTNEHTSFAIQRSSTKYLFATFRKLKNNQLSETEKLLDPMNLAMVSNLLNTKL